MQMVKTLEQVHVSFIILALVIIASITCICQGRNRFDVFYLFISKFLSTYIHIQNTHTYATGIGVFKCSSQRLILLQGITIDQGPNKC